MNVELDDVPVRSLVPEPLQGLATGEEYMQRLPEHDGEMAALLAEAEAAGECLRYVGVVDVKGGKGSVELRRYPKVGAGRVGVGVFMWVRVGVDGAELAVLGAGVGPGWWLGPS